MDNRPTECDYTKVGHANVLFLPLQAVLRNNIGRGVLDEAPIHNDVRTFTADMLGESPQVLLAGFPCQDIVAETVA